MYKRLPYCILFILCLVSATALADTYTVTSVADTLTPGTLRWAMTSANTNPGADTIDFGMLLPAEIVPASPLPTITNSNTEIMGGVYPPQVTLVGTGTTDGLQFQNVTNCTVKNLIIRNFSGNAINLNSTDYSFFLGNWLLSNTNIGLYIGSGKGNTIGGTNAGDGNVISSNLVNGITLATTNTVGNEVYGNFIGTDPTGSNVWTLAGSDGVDIGSGVSNRIGGPGPGQGNVIAGFEYGIRISSSNASGNVVAGNRIGVDASGRFPLRNLYSVNIYNAPGNTIGGVEPGARNIIASSNTCIQIDNPSAHHNMILNNYIGVAADGLTVLTNRLDGIAIDSAPSNTIGGSSAAARNVIGGAMRGIYIRNAGAAGNMIQGNHIGIDASGTASISNRSANINIDSAPGTIIGGTNSTTRNVISGCVQMGIKVAGTTAAGTVIQGNFIGTDAAGMLPVSNKWQGISLEAPECQVGGTVLSEWNLISGNGNDGILLSGTDAHGNVIQGNRIGVDVTGTNALGNGFGVTISGAASNTIGGTVVGAGNVISGNRNSGINMVLQAAFNTIEGNRIGTDAAATLLLGNGGSGILVSSCSLSNRIGSALGPNYIGDNNYGIFVEYTTGTIVRANYVGNNGTTAIPNRGSGIYLSTGCGLTRIGTILGIDGNVVSGNKGNGVFAEDAGPTILNNFIGVTRTGIPLSNNLHGIEGYDLDSALIAGNVVSANGQHGLNLISPRSCTLQGNFIGTDPAGAAAMGNSRAGIYVQGGVSNNIGVAGGGNLVSGNGEHGIWLDGSGVAFTTIQGNRIGTDMAGRSAIPNADDGIMIQCSSNNWIGGTNAAERNIVSGNAENGIELACVSTVENSIHGNYIGVGMDGTNVLGNGVDGIRIKDGASTNWIGDMDTNTVNVIAFNGQCGVRVFAGQHNAMNANSIYCNNNLGIDLEPEGVTTNDPFDADAGPNTLQNSPVLLSVSNDGVQITVAWLLDCAPGRLHVVQFYSNLGPDLSGFGEGEEPLMPVVPVFTPIGGIVGSTNVFAAPNPPPDFISATATAVIGSDGETSEFSNTLLLDSDGDGMGDGYETIYFGSHIGGNPNGHADIDGFSNLEEFLADTDPTRAVSHLQISSITASGINKVLEFFGSRERAYRAMYTQSLPGGEAAWLPIASTMTRNGEQITMQPGMNNTNAVHYRVVGRLP